MTIRTQMVAQNCPYEYHHITRPQINLDVHECMHASKRSKKYRNNRLYASAQKIEKLRQDTEQVDYAQRQLEYDVAPIRVSCFFF